MSAAQPIQLQNRQLVGSPQSIQYPQPHMMPIHSATRSSSQASIQEMSPKPRFMNAQFDDIASSPKTIESKGSNLGSAPYFSKQIPAFHTPSSTKIILNTNAVQQPSSQSNVIYPVHQPGGYIAKPSTSQRRVIPVKSNPMDNFVLESVQKQHNTIQQQQQMDQRKQSKPMTHKVSSNKIGSNDGGDIQEYQDIVEDDLQRPRSEISGETMQQQYGFDADLLDVKIVERIEKYKKDKDMKDRQMNMLKQDYDKADLVTRVQRYGQKALYEELKLKEIELKKLLLAKTAEPGKERIPLVQAEGDEQTKKQNNIIQRNIAMSGQDLQSGVAELYRPSTYSIPFSNQALFNNLSEKERYMKISTEFNKLKSQMELHRHEDFEIASQYLKAKLGNRSGEITRDQVRAFMKFIKDERRLFDLRKTIDEIITDAMNGQYDFTQSYVQSAQTNKNRAATAEIAQLINNHQNSKQDLGSNYVTWNEKTPFNYDALPRQLPIKGPSRRHHQRKNKLLYQRKVPHGAIAPKKLHSIMTNYLDENKKFEAKEIIAPSIENNKEFSLAVNFNKETINTVLSFARESKRGLVQSMSTNQLLPVVDKQNGSQLQRLKTSGSQQQLIIGAGDSEAIYKRNRLMLEHVMLERAKKRLEKREERKMEKQKPPQTSDWVMRRAISNEAFRNIKSSQAASQSKNIYDIK